MDEITRAVAGFAAGSGSLPANVRNEARRAFFNMVGCMIGGARHDIVDIADRALSPLTDSRQAGLVCRGTRTDVLNASLINCLASTVQAFNDTLEGTLLHPGGSVAAPVLALAEIRPVSGGRLLEAFALGMEVSCRLGRAATAPAVPGNIGWCATSITGGVGAAVAAGRLLGLDEKGMHYAIGLALSQASGFRATQGTMNHDMIHAWPAPAGLRAALLAEQGFTSTLAPIEGRYGFLSVFTDGATGGALTDGLGHRFELLRNTYKPYPCGVVITPVIDACLELRDGNRLHLGQVARVTVRVSSETVSICDRPHPRSPGQAVVSLQYWCAVALHRGRATLQDLEAAAIDDRLLGELQDRITPVAEPDLAAGVAVVTVETADGARLEARVDECTGSTARPLSDGQLEAKFLHQAEPIVGPVRARRMAEMTWGLDRLDDAADLARLLAA